MDTEQAVAAQADTPASVPAPTNVKEFEARLLEVADRLPKRLKQCADFVAANQDRIAVSTVAEMAEGAGVQSSAFMRFCQILGFSGFSEMQKLFREEQQNLPLVQEQIKADGQRQHQRDVKSNTVGQGDPRKYAGICPVSACEAAHRAGHIGHAAGEAQFIFIPCQNPDGTANHPRLIGGENRGLRGMVKID